ncbi:MAG: DUF1800 domain-containing protein [Proteobacteria bacterium]|nr:DUF1800 domain-containing protein [Pseudomonadota bacterium]
MTPAALPRTRALATVALLGLLTACGGQNPESDSAALSQSDTRRSALAATGATRTEAFRLLNQASFGANASTLSRIQSVGTAKWIDEQLAMPAQDVHRTRWLAADAAIKKGDPKATAGNNEVISSIYERALFADDQLRQRVKLALSEIFVISLIEVSGTQAEMAASYYDMLGRNAFGNFRTLLQDVTMHPAMGKYLSHLRNQPADPVTGRQPDQNFAREVMQLFSIGLVQLNPDGTAKLSGGLPIPTYDQDDVAGIASTFTGFSWYGPDTSKPRFFGGDPAYADPNRYGTPMQGYPQYHAITPKVFLGTQVPAQKVADPDASVKIAVDTLFKHANVGPFIGRQLIQRLVTSDPSPAYVQRVANKFANNGNGVRGDMKAVLRAVLNDKEARRAGVASGERYGKVREPILRVTAWLRAFNATSDSGKVLIAPTSDAATELNQTPLSSPSVFNFYRPGYIPAGGEADAARMTLPEMQITNETSIAGYANYMMGVVQRGIGPRGEDNLGERPDMQPNYTAETALAEDPPALVTQVFDKLLPSSPSATLRNEVLAAVQAHTMPPKRPDDSNALARDNAKARRVQTAILLTLVSPEFIVQK